MPVKAELVSLTSTPLLIATGVGADHVTVLLRNPTATIYIGGLTVDQTNGMPLTTVDSISIDLQQSDALYAMTATTATVNVLRTRA